MNQNTCHQTIIPPRAEVLLALLRIAIGWHFLYEGWTKLLYPGWTSVGYLSSSTGPLGAFFHWLAADPVRVRSVDLLNQWGLLLIGLALMLGLLVRPAAIAGMALLSLYYIAYPPLFAPVTAGASEGNYVVIDKNLIELLALGVIFMLPAARLSLQRLFNRKGRSAPAAPVLASRRELAAALIGIPALGALVLSVLRKHGWRSFEETAIQGYRHGKREFTASATVKSFQFTPARELKGQMPQAKIGNLSLSRMILGGNLMGGWAHARDLIYVSKLVKAYHSRNKVFETFAIAERCGVNTILTNPALCGVINDYWRAGGRIQFISDCGGKDIIEGIRRSIDQGAAGCYFHGGITDGLVEQGRFDIIHKGLELIRKNGLPAGIGGHKLATIRGCVEKGIHPDFWMKTLHQTNYWSAKQPESWAGSDWSKPDNIWCEDPEAVAEYMKNLPEPWMAFKTLAAGAIDPKVAFPYAFQCGADFIVVGMYDFQIVENVNLAISVLNGPLIRRREWRA